MFAQADALCTSAGIARQQAMLGSVHRALGNLQCTLTVCDASCKAIKLPRGETCETSLSVQTRA